MAFFGRVTDELVPRSDSRLRVLDIGCATGATIGNLLWLGWEIDGIEWDPVAADRARAATGQRIWSGDFIETELPVNYYDVLILSHVIEHLSDTRRAFQRFGELLKPGGRVVLFFPNHRSFGAGLYGRDWMPWEAPRHLVLPSRKGLSIAAGRAGFRLTSFSTRIRSPLAVAESFAMSECYRKNIPLQPKTWTVRARHMWQMRLEKLLVALGLNVGEEVICVLTTTK